MDNNKHAIHTLTAAGRQIAIDELSGVQRDNVKGVDGDADVVSGPFSIDFEALYHEAKASATETLSGGNVSGNTTFGTPWQPEIVYVNGDLKINGNAKGYGVLVVDGEIDATGNFAWEGLVVVRDDAGVEMNFGGTADVYGAVVLLGRDGGGSGVESDYTIRGNAQLYYSSVALGRLAPLLTTLDAAEEIVVVDQWQGSAY